MLGENIKIDTKLLRLTIEASPDAVILVREDGTILLGNQPTAMLFGYEPEKLLGLPLEKLEPSRLRKKHVSHRETYLANPAVRPIGVEAEVHGLRKDGSEFAVDVKLAHLETEEVS